MSTQQTVLTCLLDPDRDLHRVDCDPDRSDYGVERHCIVPISAADWHPDPDEHGMECDQDSHLDGPFCNPVHCFFHANDQRAITIECASDKSEPYAMKS